MLMSRRDSGSAVTASKAKYLIGALIGTSIALSTAQAATFGHSRIVSAPGQPLHLEIPVMQLTQQEIESLRATPAPAAAWQEAGMTPPVPLDTIQLVLLDGYRSDVKIIQLRSDQTFDLSIVDVLLDIRTVSGQQRFQVSLLAHADHTAVQRAGGENARSPRIIDGRAGAAMPGSHAAAGLEIRVRPGDNMFAIAQRNAVQGVTVYQMMIALQRANPQAFIEDNVNLVKAGATLEMPDIDVLTALSDREARRIFQQHVQAFERYRQRSGGADVAAISTAGAVAAQGSVSEGAPAAADSASAARAASSDVLRLSGGPGSTEARNGPAQSSVGRGGAVSGSGGEQDATVVSARDPGLDGQAGSGHNGTHSAALAGTEASRAGVMHNGASEGSRPTNQAGPAPDSMTSNGTVSDAAAPGSAVSGGSALNGAAAGIRQTDPASKGTGGVQGDPDAPVSLLASSGVIASDAAPESTAGAAPGTALGPGTAPGAAAGVGHADSDDEAALRKGMDESGKRILELEDNVRHLNEALQKQGHVAAEAALEGARSVSEAIKEVINLIEDADDKAVNGADAPATAGGGDAGAPDGSAPATAVDAASETAGAQGAPSAGTAPDERAAAAGASQQPGISGSAAAPVAGGGQASVSSERPAVTARAEKERSWLQRNPLALIGGGLALIVLIVVWLLRRASTARRDIFESDSPITDSMVREKLSGIDLDLDQSPAGGPDRRIS